MFSTSLSDIMYDNLRKELGSERILSAKSGSQSIIFFRIMDLIIDDIDEQFPRGY